MVGNYPPFFVDLSIFYSSQQHDMYIITQDEDSVSMLRGYTDIMIKEEDHSLLERFKSFLKGKIIITSREKL